MKRYKKRLVLLVAAFMMWCFSSVVMAYYDATPRIVSNLQGEWYDADGNVVLDFKGNTVNGCAIVGAYHPAGGGSNFSCIIRIIEADGYRDLPVIGENLQKDSYHAHVIFGDNMDERKGILLMRTKAAKYYESVGGIGLDMPEKEVLAKYGKPDKIQNLKPWKNLDT